MSDLIKREDAIKVISDRICDNKWVCECAINSLPSAEPQGELVNKDDAIKAVANYIWHLPNKCYKNFNSYNDIEEVVTDAIKQLPSTNDNWMPVKKHGTPHNEGLYIVTVRNWYGAGRCAFYDDVEILPYGREGWDKATAWMPFPEPYRESEVEE